MVTLDQIRQAQQRLKGIATRTPLLKYPQPINGRTLYLKPENLQPIGSFKLRGAYNKIASAHRRERRRGVIAYSSGNHAQGVAYRARAMGVKAAIVMPSNAPAIKSTGTQALGAKSVSSDPPVPSAKLAPTRP